MLNTDTMSINTDTKWNRIGYIRYMKRERPLPKSNHAERLSSSPTVVSMILCGIANKAFHSIQELL